MRLPSPYRARRLRLARAGRRAGDADARGRAARAGRARRAISALGLLVAVVGFGHAGYIEAKAGLAQMLLQHAWQRSLHDRTPVRPWPWADTHPLARLRVARLGIDEIVLSGASGRTLAFGPALSPGGARPGEVGNTVVSGHRDTHFRFLADLQPGDLIEMDAADGQYVYRVDSAEVVDARSAMLIVDTPDARLTLVTCYPFDGVVPGRSFRYLVHARLEHQANRGPGAGASETHPTTRE